MSVEVWRLGMVTEAEYLDEVPPCCDVCGRTDDEVRLDGEHWCGSCGTCGEHCEGYADCLCPECGEHRDGHDRSCWRGFYDLTLPTD